MPIKVLAAAITCALVVAAGCTDGGGSDDGARAGIEPPTVTTPARPDGPAADLNEKITGPGAPFVGLAPRSRSGRRRLRGGGARGIRGGDGLRTRRAADRGRELVVRRRTTSAPYRTRVLVRRPATRRASSGTVVVEWLNVSGGVDADVMWTNLHEEITRRGDTWVGVSAQRIGVEGGPVLVRAPGAEGIVGSGLKALYPDRYGVLGAPR